MIATFREEYFFLSNFYPCLIEFEGIVYRNAEAAFQAQKSIKEHTKKKFVGLTAREAKYLGKMIKLRSDWEEVKQQYMYQIVLAKFSQNPDLANKLINTYPEGLCEHNTWHDTYWGVCNGVGENHLGKILEKVRKELMDLKEDF